MDMLAFLRDKKVENAWLEKRIKEATHRNYVLVAGFEKHVYKQRMSNMDDHKKSKDLCIKNGFIKKRYIQ